MAQENKEVLVKEQAYLSTVADDVFSEDLDGMTITFPRIKIPAGGGTAFEVPGDDSENPDILKDFDGVIVRQQTIRAYYPDKYTGGNEPPVCSSWDGKRGTNRETGECIDCAGCEFNEWGSGEGNAKACKQRRNLYVLKEGEMLPTILALPTGSLKEYGNYLTRLLSKGRRAGNVVTKFSLKKTESSTGIKFSQVVFRAVRDLSEEEMAATDSYAKLCKEYIFANKHRELTPIDDADNPFND